MLFNNYYDNIYTVLKILAGMMELADVPDSKSGGSDTVWVRPPLPAPKRNDNFLSEDCRFFLFFSLFSFRSSLFSQIVVSGEKIREKR